MTTVEKKPTGAILKFASRLRFPVLFFISLFVFLIDLVIPEPIPFVDEILLGLIALMLGTLKKRKKKLADDEKVYEAEATEL